jgi:uroporphyrinogen decarboxylase
MEALVALAAEQGPALAARKKARARRCWIRIKGQTLDLGPSTLDDSLVLRACRREPNETVPIWLMRQAGRYMAEYQLVRNQMSFLDLCKNPELAAEVTITAVERLGVDAAIIFADILLPVEPMGVGLDFSKGEGPTILRPVRDTASIDKLHPVDVRESLGFVLHAVELVRRQMHPRIPLIGFAGAPFTMASYMIEGKGSRNYIPTKSLMHSDSQAWHRLMEKLTTVLTAYLNAQIEAGCQLVQLFDSWVGCLTPHDYREYVLPHNKRLIKSLKKGIPVIHFGTGTAALLELQKQAGGDVIGLDWRVEIGPSWERLGDIAIQGNLDPVILFSKPEVIRQEAKKILDAVGARPGFIFNLGHGILPETPVDHVISLVDYVHEWNA